MAASAAAMRSVSTGSYTSAHGRCEGDSVHHEPPPSQGERPVFGGHEVGIGFSGTYTDEGAVAEATALAGKRSIRFSAVLKKLAEAGGKRSVSQVPGAAGAMCRKGFLCEYVEFSGVHIVLNGSVEPIGVKH